MDFDPPSMFSLEDATIMVKSASEEAIKNVNKATEATAEGVKHAAAEASKSIKDMVSINDVDWGFVVTTIFTVAVFTWAGWTFYEQNILKVPKVKDEDNSNPWNNY